MQHIRFMIYNMYNLLTHSLRTRQAAIDAIHFYLQPFVLGLVSLFSGFVPLLRWYIGKFFQASFLLVYLNTLY